jgi:hypothetical protein
MQQLEKQAQDIQPSHEATETVMSERETTNASASAIETGITETEIDDTMTTMIESPAIETLATEIPVMREILETLFIEKGKGIIGILVIGTYAMHATHAMSETETLEIYGT